VVALQCDRTATDVEINEPESQGSACGVSFPTGGLAQRLPTAVDAGGFAHFLEGGHTAVRLPSPNSGYVLNPTRELVTVGAPVPQGSVLFRIGPSGE